MITRGLINDVMCLTLLNVSMGWDHVVMNPTDHVIAAGIDKRPTQHRLLCDRKMGYHTTGIHLILSHT